MFQCSDVEQLANPLNQCGVAAQAHSPAHMAIHAGNARHWRLIADVSINHSQSTRITTSLWGSPIMVLVNSNLVTSE